MVVSVFSKFEPVPVAPVVVVVLEVLVFLESTSMLAQVGVFFFVYIALTMLGAFLVSAEGLYDIETNFSAAVACISNIGPGLGAVGPMGNFAGYGPFAKIVLSILMLCGRLELFPILVLFHPAIWRKG